MSAAMARTRKPRRAVPLAIAMDHGTAIRLARGDFVVGERPDPENPNRTVRGARVIYHALWAAERLSDEHHEAADRFLVALEAAQGGRDGGTPTGVRLAPWQQGSPSERQIQAAADLRRAREALGAVAFKELVGAVGANVWPEAWGGEPADWHTAEPAQLLPLKCSLEILVEVWRIRA